MLRPVASGAGAGVLGESLSLGGPGKQPVEGPAGGAGIVVRPHPGMVRRNGPGGSAHERTGGRRRAVRRQERAFPRRPLYRGFPAGLLFLLSGGIPRKEGKPLRRPFLFLSIGARAENAEGITEAMRAPAPSSPP
jgi:hypothetical protein